jgi:hypothetical protein
LDACTALFGLTVGYVLSKLSAKSSISADAQPARVQQTVETASRTGEMPWNQAAERDVSGAEKSLDLFGPELTNRRTESALNRA